MSTTPAFVWLFDGTHGGLRYYGTCVEGVVVVQVNGFLGSDYVSESCDLPDATPAMARAFVDELLAARATKAERKARR